MDANDAKELLTSIRAETTIMSNAENVLKLISGHEIGDKAMQQIEEEQPIAYVTARANGLVAASRVDIVEGKFVDGKQVTKITWFCKDAVATRKALIDKKTDLLGENRAGVERVINKHDLDRNNSIIRKNAMKQMVLANKIVKQEELDAIHQAKATKAANIYEIGRLLIPVDAQKVVVSQMIATTGK
jgi:inhibitor of KinA sporulation pathway (predicted exonuclease)